MAVNARDTVEAVDMALDLANLGTFVWDLRNKKASAGKVAAKKTKDGKEVAEATMHSWGLDWTYEDEMTLLVDVCILIRDQKITVEEGYDFFEYLSFSPERLRSRFRKGYVTKKRGDRIAVLFTV